MSSTVVRTKRARDEDEVPVVASTTPTRKSPKRARTVEEYKPLGATLICDGDVPALGDIVTWSKEEIENRRRIVKLTRRQDSPTSVHLSFEVVESVPAGGKHEDVLSCLLLPNVSEPYITSVDVIKALSLLIAGGHGPNAVLSEGEMKILRRNIDTFQPLTIQKANPAHADVFGWVSGLSTPRVIKISKDVKVFPWRHLEAALVKVLDKHAYEPCRAITHDIVSAAHITSNDEDAAAASADTATTSDATIVVDVVSEDQSQPTLVETRDEELAFDIEAFLLQGVPFIPAISATETPYVKEVSAELAMNANFPFDPSLITELTSSTWPRGGTSDGVSPMLSDSILSEGSSDALLTPPALEELFAFFPNELLNMEFPSLAMEAPQVSALVDVNEGKAADSIDWALFFETTAPAEVVDYDPEMFFANLNLDSDVEQFMTLIQDQGAGPAFDIPVQAEDPFGELRLELIAPSF